MDIEEVGSKIVVVKTAFIHWNNLQYYNSVSSNKVVYMHHLVPYFFRLPSARYNEVASSCSYRIVCASKIPFLWRSSIAFDNFARASHFRQVP